MSIKTGIIDSVKISKLWNSHDVCISLHNDVNFLIGVNGSGKTTVINLLVAVLKIDLQYLYNTVFEKIEVKIKSLDSPHISSITVTRPITDDQPNNVFVYEIQTLDQSKSIEIKYDRRAYRRGYRYYPYAEDQFRMIQSTMANLVNFTWLSVHRHDKEDYYNDHNDTTSLVDRKIESLSNALVRHLSELKNRIDDELNTFQKKVFLSLLPWEWTDATLADSVSSTDVKQLKYSLNQIYQQLDVHSIAKSSRLDESTLDVKSSLNIQFDQLGAAKNKIEKKVNEITRQDLILFYKTTLLKKITADWEEYLEQKDNINLPKRKFIDIVNEMSINKTIEINNRNELEIHSQSKQQIEIDKLSYGEKHLLIVLTEALLQNANHYVYIADEPEMSLHIEWQESLVKNIRSINPNAQIFFATHSPDIVGSYETRIFDMEEIIS